MFLYSSLTAEVYLSLLTVVHVLGESTACIFDSTDLTDVFIVYDEVAG